MRKFPKYKQYKKDNICIYSCPKKFLKFKLTTSRKSRLGIEKRLQRLEFLKMDTVFTPSNKLESRHFFFKQKLITRRNIIQLFDGAVKLSSIKKDFSLSQKSKFDNLTFLKNTILKLEYNLDVVLYRLNLFSSIYAAQKYIDRGLVLVNSKKVSHNYYLKKGDIITIYQLNYELNSMLTNQIKTSNFLPFIEADFYTNTFVVVKDLKEISFQDITLMMTKHFNLPELYQAIFK